MIVKNSLSENANEESSESNLNIANLKEKAMALSDDHYVVLREEESKTDNTFD